MVFRLLEKYRTELFATLIALVLIIAGLIIPIFIPNERPGNPPGFEDTTWIKTLISTLLIGMGIVSWFWLIIIQRYFMGKSKEDYLY
jgi:hypothetical protein